MKKFFAVAAAVLALGLTARAQVGIIAGVTSASTTLAEAANDLKAGDITQYHVGLTTKMDLGLITVQPSLLYNVKGTQLSEVYADGSSYTADFKTGFLELPIQFQLGADLGGFRPFVFAEPFVGLAITNEFTKTFETSLGTTETETSDSSNQWDNIGSEIKDRLEYGAGLGVGIDLLGSLQVTVRYYWNMGSLYTGDSTKFKDATAKDIYNAVVDEMKTEQASGIMASVAFFF